MEDNFVHLRFNHEGKFQNTRYVGGEETAVMFVDLDKFSYTVLMEHVKDDLKYTEIGGIYVSKGDMEGWKLCADDADLNELVKAAKAAKTGEYLDFYIDNVVDCKIKPLKQMQPHVVMRPRQNLIAAKNQGKRTFVTTHQLQQQKNKKSTQLVNSPRRSSRLNELQVNSPRRLSRLINQEVNSHRRSACGDATEKVEDATVSLNVARVKRKLELINPPAASEEMGSNENMGDMAEDDDTGKSENEVLPPPPPIIDYEKNRFVNVTLNDIVYRMLGLPALATSLNAEMKKGKGRKENKKIQEEGSEYNPGAEEHTGDDGGEKPRKRTKKALKTKLPSGPTTRSRSNIVTAPLKDATDKEAAAADKEARKSILIQPATQIQLPQNEEPGSMAAYLAMRERQKNEVGKKKAAIASGSGTANQLVDGENVLPDFGDEVEEVVVRKRTRGKTNMDKVHTRPFEKRIVVNMNKKGQPISDDDNVVTELGYFLGTLRKCVPLTYKSWRDVPENLKNTLLNYVKQRYIFPEEMGKWVLKSINADWRGYKSRLKAAHYTPYTTDEERLENRPDEIPLEDFKLVLKYWGDEDVQAKAKKNAEIRQKYVETHTAGPKLFSQIRHKLVKESDGAVFVKTRKRKDDREYKTDGKVTKFLVDKIEGVLGTDLTGPTDGVDELLLQGKSHGPSWLIGRCVNSDKHSTSSTPADSQISDLTTKIRKEVVAEMEEKLEKKVEEEVDAKVNLVLSKLGQANPSISFNLVDLCAAKSSNNDNGTPVTVATS